MDLEDIAKLAAKGGAKSDPEVIKVEIQVRTGTMFPLPDWMDAADESPAPLPKLKD